MSVHWSIEVAAREAGLSPHVVRMWEKRYGAVTPKRTDSNRRLYTADEVSRLRLLGRVTATGHRIGDVARLPVAELQRLLGSAAEAAPAPATASLPPVGAALEAVQNLDEGRLSRLLDDAVLRLGPHGCVEQVVAPLATRIGEAWADGSLSAAHEHFATNVLRAFLLQSSRPYAEDANSPVLVAGTLTGQLHDLGAAVAAAQARAAGWKVLYLGASLPGSEIAGAAQRQQATCVALSFVYPTDDGLVGAELQTLRRLLPAHVEILAGGRGAAAYAAVLADISARTFDSLAGYRLHLEGLRRRPR